MSNTDRFMSEMSTAQCVQAISFNIGLNLTLRQAHECWAEHSDDYCAGWLDWRNPSDPSGEIMEALTRWQARHKPQPVSTK